MTRHTALLAAAFGYATISTALAQAPVGKPIVIGMVAEQSGPLGFYGQETARSAQIFVDQLNANGGLLGRPVRLEVRDSKTTVNEAVRHARDLAVSENVDFLLHSINSAECVAVGNVAKQAKKILFSACGNDDFTSKSGGRYIFRIPNIVARTQGFAAADYSAQRLKDAGTRYYTIAHDFAAGRSIMELFKTRMKQNNPKVEFIGEGWPKLNEASYAPFITAMMDAKPDVVSYFFAFGIPFWQQSASYELNKSFPLVSSYWGGADEMQALPRNAIPTGAVMGGLPWYAIEGDANKAFVDLYRKSFNKPPLTAAYLILLNLQALKIGVERAGTIETEKVVDTLAGMEFESILGPVKIRTFDHQGTTPLWTGRAAWDDKLNTGVLTDILKLPTELYLPTEADVKKSRE